MATMMTITAVTSIIGLVVSLGIVAGKVTIAGSVLKTVNDALNLKNITTTKNFDQPVTDMLEQCSLLLARFMDYIEVIIICCAMLCIIFNAFKLWSGTEQIKKAFVDVVYKCVIVIVISIVWPSVLAKTYTLATSIGAEAAGGSDAVKYCFAQVASNAQTVFTEGTSEFIAALSNGATKDKNGNIVISEKLLKSFTKCGLTEEEAKSWLSEKGIVTGDSGAKGVLWWKNDAAKAETRAKKAMEKYTRTNTIETYDISGNSIVVADSNSKAYMKQCIIVLRSMSEILTGIPENAIGQVDISKVLTMSKESLDSIFFNPFVSGSETRLSISTMVKTALILSKAMADGSMAPFEDYSKYSPDEKQAVVSNYLEHQDLPMITKLIGAIAKFFVYHLGMVVCTIFLLLEYSLTLIEFLLVGAVSTLLIPLFFIDATKQFASNLIKLIFSYFVKILVTTMMCFFVISMYLRMASTTQTMLYSDTITVVYYCFVLFLGLILSKSSGKIASAVISGNPSLGLGDLVNEFRSMGHMMHAASHEVEKFGRDLQRAGKAIQNTGGIAATTGAAQDSVLEGQRVASRTVGEDLRKQRDSANSTVEGLEKKRASGYVLTDAENDQLAAAQGLVDMTDKQIDATATQAGKDYAKQARKDFAKDWMYKNLTGMDSPNANSSNALRVGQQFFDGREWRTANWLDVQEAGKKGGQQFGEQAAQNAIRRNSRQMCGDIELPECNGH